MIIYNLKTIFRYCISMTNGFQSQVRRQTTKTVLNDKITPLTENTLLGRIVIYLNNNADKFKVQAMQFNGTDAIESIIYGKANNLRGLSLNEITSLFYYVNNNNTLGHNKQRMRRLLDLLDVECCLRKQNLIPSKILQLLNAFMFVVPNRITEYKFYQHVMKDTDKYLKITTKNELMQFIFYIGLSKHNKEAQVLLKKCLRNIIKEHLELVTTEDLCIICNSCYRTKTMISNLSFLNKIKDTLNGNLSLLKDATLLATLIKAIIQNHSQDDDLLSTISCTIFFNKTVKYYTFTTMSYILALFSDYLYYDEALLNFFTQKCIQELEKTGSVQSKSLHISQQLRAKDITRFLWAISNLGYGGVNKEIIDGIIVPKIQERIDIGEFKHSPYQLLSSVLHLWMLNCKPYDLISYIITLEDKQYLKVHQNQLKLNLLLTIIKCEDGEFYKKLDTRPSPPKRMDVDFESCKRPLLNKVQDSIKKVLDLEISTELKYQIPYLNILGIVVSKSGSNQAVNVEVLDHYTCVRNKDCHPTGLMQLKLRILDESSIPLVTIQQSEVQSMSDSELMLFLKEELRFYF